MPSLGPYIGPAKLIIAFDIGTTHSGISYCILQPGQIPEVFGVTRFPAQEHSGGDAKVPSLLYYDRHGVVKAVGAEVRNENVAEDALMNEWTMAEWWKLHLRPANLVSSIAKDNNLPPLPSGKSAVDVFTDFIKYLFRCAKTYILERHLAFPSWSTIEGSIEYIFTHPNGWEGAQQQLYRQAIVYAGLIPNTPEGQSRVHLLTEGEASLHFYVQNLLSMEAVDDTNPRGIVVINAGGGVIDLSMFSMTTNPISCKEIAPAECRLQGSVFVTCRARDLLKRKLIGWDGFSEVELSEITREFDRSTKLVVRSDLEPAYIKVAGRRYNNAKYNIVYGKLKLSGAEAVSLFDDSVNAIIGAFEQQLKYATVPITTALFLGGLSTSDWIWSRLHSYFKANNVYICRPDNHINKAVANGAVLSCIDRENHLVVSRVARATFGVLCAVSVNDNDEQHIRRRDRWELDPSGDRYLPGYFDSKLFKGVGVHEEMEFRESFSLTERDPKDFDVQTVRLVCYRGSLSDPKWVDEDPASFSTLCTIHVNLRAAQEDLVRRRKFGRVHYRLDYDVIVFFGLMELQAQVAWRTRYGERRIPAIISYDM